MNDLPKEAEDAYRDVRNHSGPALLGTIALAQNVTYDYDRAANFSELQDIRVDSRDRADRRAEQRARRSSRRFPTPGRGAHEGGTERES